MTATFDPHKNFAYATVFIPPSPPSSGLQLTLEPGEGALMPATPFNATVWEAGVVANVTNAEIVRVTAITVDTLTIQRAQESTSARTIQSGDQIAASVTVKTVTDIENAVIDETTRAELAESFLGSRVPLVASIGSTASPEVNIGNTDWAQISNLSTGITGFTIVGVPGNRQKLVVSVTDNGTPQNIVWGSGFIGSGVAALPSSTVVGKEITVFFIYNQSRSLWVCMAVDAIGY